jgi:hypothetical protein
MPRCSPCAAGSAPFALGGLGRKSSLVLTETSRTVLTETPEPQPGRPLPAQRALDAIGDAPYLTRVELWSAGICGALPLVPLVLGGLLWAHGNSVSTAVALSVVFVIASMAAIVAMLLLTRRALAQTVQTRGASGLAWAELLRAQMLRDLVGGVTVLGAAGGALVLFFGVADGWRDSPDWYLPAMVVTTVLGGAALLAGLAAAAADTDLRWAREHILGPPGPVGHVILSIDPGASTPAYEQIRDQVVAAAAAGTLRPDPRLPTVRQLAGDLGLAANTVARAYRVLEAEVTSRRAGVTARSCWVAGKTPGTTRCWRGVLGKVHTHPRFHVTWAPGHGKTAQSSGYSHRRASPAPSRARQAGQGLCRARPGERITGGDH